MPDFTKKTDWTLDDVSFTYLDGRHRGRGLLTWDHGTGFHLEAFVSRSGPPLPTPLHFWRVRLATRRDRTSIRMRMGRAHAVAFVTLTDRFDVVHDHRLSCDLSSVHFMTPLPEVARSAKRWSGSALIQGGSALWPDTLVETVQLAGATISESLSRRGLVFETQTLNVRGQEEDGRFAIHWSMDKAAYRRNDAWRWPTAFRDALSIELGCFLPLLQRETHVFPSHHLHRLRPGRVVQLHPFQPFDGDLVDKPRLFLLTEFFAKATREAEVCRRLFDQMVRAVRQERWDDTELILSTALEGALRALDGVPSSDRAWDLERSLKSFRAKHLSPEWRRPCRQAVAAFRRLRHSTAHPDWIVDKMDPGAEVERSASFNDLRLLSRFYGYMILALAGAQDLRPVFDGQPANEQTQTPSGPPEPSRPGGSPSTEVM